MLKNGKKYQPKKITACIQYLYIYTRRLARWGVGNTNIFDILHTGSDINIEKNSNLLF